MAIPPNAARDAVQANTERLFFALWPDADLRRRLYQLTDNFLPSRGGRRVAEENLHLTLTFLGSLTREVRGCLERLAGSIGSARFTLVLEEIGCWRRTGVMWVGPEQTPPPLLSLVEALNAAQSACGLHPDLRAYRAHLTLARKVRKCQREYRIEPIFWEATKFCLVVSNIYSGGARYQILRSWDLA
jgi:RNA 2',3'-cyclic 3'-phosphodiesterase